MNYAPIIVFAFIRLDTLRKVIEGLKKNEESNFSDLYIFIDGPRNKHDEKLVSEVSSYCHSIEGFANVSVIESSINIGLDQSVINGVTKVINQKGNAIILEDDVVPSTNFLSYMNQCLSLYEKDNRVMSISGFGVDVKIPEGYDNDVFLFGRSTSWGWATWKDRWNIIDWEVKDWPQIKKSRRFKKLFNRNGGDDMYSLLKGCMEGGNMWDIRFCYNMFKYHKYSIVPFVSKTDNIGFNELAIHCKPVKYKRFTYTFDRSNNKEFRISDKIELNSDIIKQRLRISSNYIRIITRLKNIINF